MVLPWHRVWAQGHSIAWLSCLHSNNFQLRLSVVLAEIFETEVRQGVSRSRSRSRRHTNGKLLCQRKNVQNLKSKYKVHIYISYCTLCSQGTQTIINLMSKHDRLPLSIKLWKGMQHAQVSISKNSSCEFHSWYSKCMYYSFRVLSRLFHSAGEFSLASVAQSIWHLLKC